MISIPKLPIDALIFTIIGLVLSFILVWPTSYKPESLPNYTFNTRIFTNIVVGGDIIEPEIFTPGPAIPTPIVAPIPSITPIPAQTPIITNRITNSSTNYSNTNSSNIGVTNTN